MKHLCGFVWKIFEENNFATILLYCGKKVSSSLFLLYNYAIKIGRAAGKILLNCLPVEEKAQNGRQ